MSDDLVVRLQATLNTLEDLALRASPGPWKANAEHDEVWAVDDIEVATGFALSNNQLRDTVDHIVANDPVARLRLVQAHRDILDKRQEAIDYRDHLNKVRAHGAIVMALDGAVEAWDEALKIVARGYGLEDQT